MKIPVTQVILGVIILFACIYIGVWMLSGIDSLLDETVLDSHGNLVPNVTPSYESLFDFSRYAFFLLAALGLITIITGVFCCRSGRKRAFAVIQAVCGVLTAVVAAFIIVCGCSLNYILAIEGGPVLVLSRVTWLNAITGFLGIVVAVLAVVQLVIMRSAGMVQVITART